MSNGNVWIVAAATVITGSVLIAAPGTPAERSESSEIAELRQRIEALEARVARLESQGPTTASLAGSWRVRMPRGHESDVTIRRMSDDEVHLQFPGNMTGTYRLENGRLVVTEPEDKNHMGWEWTIEGDGRSMVLTGTAPVEQVGSDYTGATLTRVDP